jgi:xanthine dehydrogenase accessory factor
MREVLGDIERWRSTGRRVALARVVGVEGSGSVSGGCVEGAVVTEALDVLGGDGRARLCTFGYSDDEAFAVGLTCGGTIHLLVEPLDW